MICDSRQITEVLTHLLKNAVETIEEKYKKEPGENIWFLLLNTPKKLRLRFKITVLVFLLNFRISS